MEGISCTLVTCRPHLCFDSIINFNRQTWTEKELVIVASGTEEELNVLKKFIRDKSLVCKYVEMPLSYTLGQVRNVALSKCKYDLYCQWDDDDISRFDRLEQQYNFLKQNDYDITLLKNQYHNYNGSIYPTVKKGKKISHSGWPGTILAKTKIIQGQYEKSEMGEDVELLEKLEQKYSIGILEKNVDDYLYFYQFNGNNTWDKRHHKILINTFAEFDKEIRKYNYQDIKKNIIDRFNIPNGNYSFHSNTGKKFNFQVFQEYISCNQ